MRPFVTADGRRTRILQIGNYPPPWCGWAIQTKMLVDEIRRRGAICEVLKLNEGRRKKSKSKEYVDVQNGLDYLLKLVRFAANGYRFQPHVNGWSKPGYMLALLAAIVGRLAGRPVALSWHGGLQQKYFPRSENGFARRAFRLLFRMAGEIACDDITVKRAIESYGIAPERVAAIACFSRQNLVFQRVSFARETEAFLTRHWPVFFCYVSFRPEYQLPELRIAMTRFRQHHARAGFIWLGFPDKELPPAKDFVGGWPKHEREALLLLGNLSHDEFLTLLARSTAYIRTPSCDGVAASVLESLALGTPVVASENHHRPAGVITYSQHDDEDLCRKLVDLIARYEEIKEQIHLEEAEDNIMRAADWVLGETTAGKDPSSTSLVHAG